MTTSPRDSTAIDRFVGNRIKTQRETLGLSQEDLADALGISFQQVQKYERGFNRVSASRLFALATALNVSIAYFFEGLENQSQETPETIAALLSCPESIPLLETFTKLPTATRRIASQLIELLGA